MQRNSKALPWRARGISDTLDASETFNGAMMSLQNLIPHPSTKTLWQCRPAATTRVNFSLLGPGFSSGFSIGFGPRAPVILPVGPISLLKVIGNYAYGMIASSDFPGHDIPFIINLLSNTPVLIDRTTITQANTPQTQPFIGPWTPPTGTMIGSKFIVTHPGFNGLGTNFVGQIDVTNPLAPTWSTQQLTGGSGLVFQVPPIAVYQYNGRAWYIHNLASQPAVIFSDSLNPTVATNANQVLTFGDAAPLTALGGLPLNNQLGGIIQALIVFKGVSNIYQITGDPATSNLALNALNVTTGTLAQNSVCNGPKGLFFMSPDGMRQIDFNAHVSDPVGIDGQGICMPFIYAVVPSRVCAACGGNVLRISVQNGNAPGSPFQEYWYDVSRQIWSGPHTFPFAVIQPYNNTFIGEPVHPIADGTLWQSDVVQSPETSTFIENGQQMFWTWWTPLLPDTDQMTNNAITETSMHLSFDPSVPVVSCQFLTESLTVLNNTVLAPSGIKATVWGQFVWGQAPWGGTGLAYSPFQIAWDQPLVFARGSYQMSGQSAPRITIGALHMRYQVLRYLVNQGAAA